MHLHATLTLLVSIKRCIIKTDHQIWVAKICLPGKLKYLPTKQEYFVQEKNERLSHVPHLSAANVSRASGKKGCIEDMPDRQTEKQRAREKVKFSLNFSWEKFWAHKAHLILFDAISPLMIVSSSHLQHINWTPTRHVTFVSHWMAQCRQQNLHKPLKKKNCVEEIKLLEF